MKPVNRLITRLWLLNKRSVCFSFALLLCALAYVCWSVGGSHTESSFAASVPVEIGHRVWLDSNRNGLQDAGEPGIKGVTVHLYNSNGQMIGSTTTDANGQYHFMVSPDAEYTIKLDNAADYSNGPLKGDQLTEAKSNCDDVSASRAMLPKGDKAIGEGNYPQIAVTHLVAGKNADIFNVGFAPATGKTAGGRSWSRCKPFPPEDKPTSTPTAGSNPVVTPTTTATTTPGPEKPTATVTPEPKKPTAVATSEPKKPIPPKKTATKSGNATEFPSLPATGSDPAAYAGSTLP